ncbi:MAG: hypothetical protein SGI71_10105 [Verrucomicrobiota bacterium]|nr:hypothetical protein [Verrucomicrobiota bacterium]
MAALLLFFSVLPLAIYAQDFKVVALESKVTATLPSGKIVDQIKLGDTLPLGTRIKSDSTGQAILQAGSSFNVFSVYPDSNLKLEL